MSLQIIKAANSTNLLLGTFTNRWIDREAQIITDEAHKEFIQFLDEHPERSPQLWFWHNPDVTFGNKASHWFYNNGFLSMIWELSANEADFIQSFDRLYEAGMSHYALADFDSANDIIRYRTIEASILPLDKAANINTSIEVLKKEQKRMTPEQMKALIQSYGIEATLELTNEINELSEKATELDNAGVATKEVTNPVADEPGTVEDETENAPLPIIDEAELVQVLQARDEQIEQILDENRQAIASLQEQVATLTKQLSLAKQLGSSRSTLKHYAERIAESGKSVIGTEAAKVDGRSALAKSKPKENETNNHVLAGILPQFQGGK